MTREEHLKSCKDRAMEYVKSGNLLEAVTSKMSDIRKHPEMQGGALDMLGLVAAQQAQSGDRDGVIRYIQGFN